MPPRRTYRSKRTYTRRTRATTYRKRTYRKRYSRATTRDTRNYTRTGYTVQRGKEPFGSKFFGVLQYATVGTPASGSLGTVALSDTFALNSLYDPDVTGVGHQPYQYDQVVQAYERIWVRGCKVTLTFDNPSDNGLIVGYRVRANTDPYALNGSNYMYLLEKQNVRFKTLAYNGSGQARFSFYVDNATVFGITKKQYNINLEYSHTAGANPPAFSLLDVWVCNPATLVNVTCRYTLQLQFYATFTNPITLLNS